MKRTFKRLMVLILALSALFVLAAPTSALADTVTLNPDADGDLADLALVKPAGWQRWQAVNSDDGDTSYAWMNGDWNTDLSQFTDIVSPAGTINSVTVWIKARALVTPSQTGARTAIKTHDTVYYGDEETLSTSYGNYYTTYTTNPSTGAAWTWAEISALQGGVSLRRSNTDATPGTQRASRCTQVWVVVDYTNSLEFAGWRPPVSLEGHEWKSGSTMPVKFLIEDGAGNPATSGVVAMVQIGASDTVQAVWDPDYEEGYIGQWKAEVKLADSGWQAVIISGNVTGVTPLQINVKP